MNPAAISTIFAGAIVIAGLFYIIYREGRLVFYCALALVILYSLFYAAMSPFIFPVLFLTAPFYYYRKFGGKKEGKEKYKGKKATPSKKVNALKLLRLDKFEFRDIIYGIGLFILTMAVFAVLSLAITLAGLNDSANVVEKLAGIPLLILVPLVILGSISEEIFFRGFLVREIGPFVSAALFGLGHIVYGSMAEIMVALAIGFIFSYFFYYTKRLYPVIITHLMYNLFMLLIVFVIKVKVA